MLYKSYFQTLKWSTFFGWSYYIKLGLYFLMFIEKIPPKKEKRKEKEYLHHEFRLSVFKLNL